MYTTKPAFVYGFHGTDKELAYEILNRKVDFTPSDNCYDWLGFGVYFWENDVDRALEYANESMGRSKNEIKNPFALGAVIDLGTCLDLLSQKYLMFVSEAYEKIKRDFEINGVLLPTNKGFGKNDFDFRNRELDCLVINYAVRLLKRNGVEVDTVRAAFLEGVPLYEGAGFKTKNHIQIAVLNTECIKGVFLPREKKKIEMKKQS